MDFSFSAEQDLLRSQARSFLKAQGEIGILQRLAGRAFQQIVFGRNDDQLA